MQFTAKLMVALAVTFTLAACAGPFPFVGPPAVTREVIEGEVRAKLADSQVSTFFLELQTIRWVDENMAARVGEPLTYAQSGHAPDQRVWVAFVEGRLSTSIWPTPIQAGTSPGKPRPPEAPATAPRTVQAFSMALVLIDPESGGLIAMRAKPAREED